MENLIQPHDSAFDQKDRSCSLAPPLISLSYPAGADLGTLHAFLVDD